MMKRLFKGGTVSQRGRSEKDRSLVKGEKDSCGREKILNFRMRKRSM